MTVFVSVGVAIPGRMPVTGQEMQPWRYGALAANKVDIILGGEAGGRLVDAFEMFRIGKPLMCRSTFKASATDSPAFWATGISYSG